MQLNEQKISELKNKALGLPEEPGVYIMRDANGVIIYIGKAKRLKRRVVSYFRNLKNHLPKVYQMVIRVNDFDHIVCDSEFEALVLECNLIKEHTPKYNILLKDDKGYHYVKISGRDYPKISTAKQSDKNSDKSGAEFIGPYMSAFAVKRIVEDANKIFKLPTCNKVFPRDFKKQRPCLQHHIGLCSAPCTGDISKEEYNKTFSEALDFIKGNGNINLCALKKRMQDASEALEFELAARLRDRIRAAEKIRENQKIFISSRAAIDVVALAAGERQCCICVLKYRKGRLIDSTQHIFDNSDSFEEMLSSFTVQYYADTTDIPSEIYVNLCMPDKELIQKLISEKSGKKAVISVPQKGEKYRLLLLSQSNASEGLSSVLNLSGKEVYALDELSRLLSLDYVPKYIESYDISNLGDRHIVGGMVVFENGRPLKSAYKKFAIKDQLIQDDYSAMRQVIKRRFEEFKNAENHTEGFGRLPDLILLDGGRGHVSAVSPILEELNLDIPLFGMVKDGKHRTRAITGEREISIKSSRSAFTLVSKIQDEVHRYTVSFEAARHKRASLEMSLTKIDGIGKAKASALLKHFKTIKAIKEAQECDLTAVKGISLTLAKQIKEALKD